MNNNLDYGKPNGRSYDIEFSSYSLSFISFLKGCVHDPIAGSLQESF